MGAPIRFLGRLLFVTILLTSAVIKIREPSTQVGSLTADYNTIRELHPVVTGVLPTTSTVQMLLFRSPPTFLWAQWLEFSEPSKPWLPCSLFSETHLVASFCSSTWLFQQLWVSALLSLRPSPSRSLTLWSVCSPRYLFNYLDFHRCNLLRIFFGFHAQNPEQKSAC